MSFLPPLELIEGEKERDESKSVSVCFNEERSRKKERREKKPENERKMKKKTSHLARLSSVCSLTLMSSRHSVCNPRSLLALTLSYHESGFHV